MKKNRVSTCCCLAIVILLGGGGAGCFGAVAEPSAGMATKALSLQEAVRIALQSNPELRGLGARVQAAAGRAYQAGRWTNPELGLNAEEWPVSNGHGFSDA